MIQIGANLRQALHGAAREPRVLLSQDKDEASLRAVLEGLIEFTVKEKALVQARREQARLDTLAELVEARAMELARQWAAQHSSASQNPYDGYLKFESSQLAFPK